MRVSSIGTTLENDLAVFLKTTGKPFCDINLVLDGHIIPAHMSIMLARCAYFQAMFRSFMPTDNSVNVGQMFLLIMLLVFNNRVLILFLDSNR